MALLYVLAFIAILIAALYLYLTWNLNYWKKQGIVQVPGTVAVFGDISQLFFFKENVSMMCERFYNIQRGNSMIGFFFLRTPALLLKDPELVKSVLVTNFSHFQANIFQLDPAADRLLTQNPFFATGEAWKVSRSRLTNMFSSKKLRIFFDVIHRVCDKMNTFMARKIKENDGVYEVELKELFAKFTGEVAANAGYGIEGHCFEDNPGPDTFATMAAKIFDLTIVNSLAQVALFYVPSVARLFGLRFINKNVEHFFIDIVKSVMKDRKENKQERQDVVQFTLDALEEPDEEVVAGQLMSFFIDVFETSSLAASFVAYRLANHPDVQRKTREEVLSVLKKHNGKFTYESIKDMTYLDQVVNESLRMQTPAGAVIKYCTERCVLTGSDGQSCLVDPGTVICVPIQSLHMDEKFWPDPETFNPDRFHPDNRADIVKYTHMPFSEGPRACVGMRLAVMQMKALIIMMLRNYSLEVSPKTQTPLQLDPQAFLTAIKGGLWARFKVLK